MRGDERVEHAAEEIAVTHHGCDVEAEHTIQVFKGSHWPASPGTASIPTGGRQPKPRR